MTVCSRNQKIFFFGPIIHAKLNGKRNQNFFFIDFYFRHSKNQTILVKNDSENPNYPTDDRLFTKSKNIFWSQYSCQTEGKTKQKNFFIDFYFRHSKTRQFWSKTTLKTLTTRPSPDDGLFTKSKNIFFVPIIHAKLKGKRNQNFFHRLLFSDTPKPDKLIPKRPEKPKPPDPRHMTVWSRISKIFSFYFINA